VYEKLTKYPNFAWPLPEKLSKYSNFYDIGSKSKQNCRILHDFCPKNACILHNNRPNNIFLWILGARGAPAIPLPRLICHSEPGQSQVICVSAPPWFTPSIASMMITIYSLSRLVQVWLSRNVTTVVYTGAKFHENRTTVRTNQPTNTTTPGGKNN